MCVQSRPVLFDPMDCSPPGSSVHGILQARIPEWVATSSSRGSSQIKDLSLLCLMHWQVDSLPLHQTGKPPKGDLYVITPHCTPVVGVGITAPISPKKEPVFVGLKLLPKVSNWSKEKPKTTDAKPGDSSTSSPCS